MENVKKVTKRDYFEMKDYREYEERTRAVCSGSG